MVAKTITKKREKNVNLRGVGEDDNIDAINDRHLAAGKVPTLKGEKFATRDFPIIKSDGSYLQGNIAVSTYALPS